MTPGFELSEAIQETLSPGERELIKQQQQNKSSHQSLSKH
jgi:hypothetical protein